MSKRTPLPPYDVLHVLLRYESETGKLYWKSRDTQMFGDKPHLFSAFNAKCANKEAFCVQGRNGYLRGIILQTPYLAHRIIYKMVHNEEPPQIDHINHDRADNRIVNLQASTQAENHRNRRQHKNNTSGAAGVQWYENLQKWAARVWVGGRAGKNIYLGSYDTVVEAAAVVDAKRKEMGFHPNHGVKNVG